MPYTDPLEPMLQRADELRRRIALRIVEEAGATPPPSPSADHLAAADEAIAAWDEQGEEEQDQRAFRNIGPLQELLAEYQATIERIVEERDRRLG
ncbi:hypothetical protein QO058_26385 [Bosea vestrisii]|uniref:TilS substrate-binding domain-containing protein n=1 Tax=Bosea vestrisii TaxID=151416 RepID=UPI0024DFE352|nr:TilS substrate-binding domain-containing protein [Bosea vestrisii]WID96216.1 hypothetical protein QO058_26385 [Bosea vestrisii]